MHHELKILSSYFKAVIDGSKRFEIRNNADRGFQKGDTAELIEIQQGATIDTKTGRAANIQITYVSNFNQPQNQVVFGFKVIEIFP